MMSNNYKAYKSASEWLSFLKEDVAWLSQLEQLQAAQPDELNAHYDDAIRRIGREDAFEFWGIYKHKVEPVVTELWEEQKLSLSSLKIQTIGMLSLEWLEENANVEMKPSLQIDKKQEIIEQLLPIFWNDKTEAVRFYTGIQGMKPKQITDWVKKLVSEKKISDISKGRNLWMVLHDNNLYKPTEANWNMQLK